MEGDSLFEPVHFKLSGHRVSGSPCLALELDGGYCITKSLFGEKNIIRADDFDLVWWDGMRRVINGYPKMYRVWLMKHVSEFSGNNVQMYYWSKGKHSPKCEFCCTYNEHNMHICRCKDPGRDSMFRTLVGELSTWLQFSLGKQTVLAMVAQYLLSHREEQMSDCVHGTNSLLHSVVSAGDHLGWDCMLEGCISIQWLQLVAPLLRRTGRRLLPQAWGISFITKLHSIVHKQWIYRNLVIHYCGKDGLTIPEHHDIIN
jgi:hypothetical protein